MRYCKLNRSEFVDMINSMERNQPGLLFRYYNQPDRSPYAHELWACWHDDSLNEDPLPAFIIVADDGLNDFLAWSLNFIPAYRPLSSFLRILPWSFFLSFREKRSIASSKIRSVFVGAILGETLADSTGKGFLATLPITSFESTYSYAMSRAFSLGVDQNIMSYVSDGWYKARECTEQKARKLSFSSLKTLWRVILSLSSNNTSASMDLLPENRINILAEACRDIESGNNLSSHHWRILSDGRITNADISESMKSTREHRVEIFEEVVDRLSGQSPDELYSSFLVGYLASMIGDGSLEHAHLFYPIQNMMPSAIFWYGVCSSLLPNNRILTENDNLGLKILRLLNKEENLSFVPSCDISLPELEVMFRGSPKSRHFRQFQSSSLRIEIAPMVTTVVRWPASQGGSGQYGLFNGEDHIKAQKQSIPGESERLNELASNLKSSLSILESLINLKQTESVPKKETKASRGKRRR